jgi:D-alanyl-D-alanine carboxypeptidase
MTGREPSRHAAGRQSLLALCAVLMLLVIACAGPAESPAPDQAPTATATAPAPTAAPTQQVGPATPTTPTTPGAPATPMAPTQTPLQPIAPEATLPPPAEGTPPPEATPPALPTEPTEPAPTDPELTPVLQQMLEDWLAEDGAPGAVLGVRLADGRTAVVASGETDAGTGRPVDPGHRFRIGSITKTFIGALVVQLSEEGLLDLSETLESHLPGAPHAGEVTVRQLLDHTSGMPDFAAQAAYRAALLRAPGREWSPQEVVDLVASLELDFEPGTGWAYSNSNYLLLGMLAEEVGGEDLEVLLRERIIEPLGLGSTYLEGFEDSPELAVSGHFDLDGDGSPDNVRAIPYTALVTSGAAAGGISASALDVLDFATGLFSAQLVDRDGLAEMMAINPPSTRYGAGLALFQPGGIEGWGHSGALPGFSTLLVHSVTEEVTIVGMANESGADVGSLVARTAALLLGR